MSHKLTNLNFKGVIVTDDKLFMGGLNFGLSAIQALMHGFEVVTNLGYSSIYQKGHKSQWFLFQRVYFKDLYPEGSFFQ